jgi:hypothetical protein
MQVAADKGRRASGQKQEKSHNLIGTKHMRVYACIREPSGIDLVDGWCNAGAAFRLREGEGVVQ